MKCELRAIRSTYGAISIDYKKCNENGEFELVRGETNISKDIKDEIYECIRKVESLLNQENKPSTSPCDYCVHAVGNSCPVKACYEYSRWKNNGKAPQEVIDRVNDFHYDRW